MPIRVTVRQEGTRVAKPAVIKDECKLPDLMKIAKNKLRVNPKQLLVEGTPLTEDNLHALQNGMEIVASLTVVEQDPNSEKSNNNCNTDTPMQSSSAKSGSQGLVLGPPDTQVTLLCKESEVESDAITQLRRTVSDYPSIRVAVGMPDLHPGPQFPIGAAFASVGEIMPFLVGNDVGCGMSLFATSLKDQGQKKAQKWASMLECMDRPFEGDCQGWLESLGVESTEFDKESLGTIGGGNHFAELQAIQSIADRGAFEEMGLAERSVYLLVHSGSRAYGNWILKQHLGRHGVRSIKEGSKDFEEYMRRHDNACKWASCNRKLIGFRFLSALGAATNTLDAPFLDICHNNVVQSDGLGNPGERMWLHRKGAAPSDQGPVVIPGSRGTFSYLVVPTDNVPAQRSAALSLAHGAGRRWDRSKALAAGQTKYPNPKALTTTPLGGCVVCDDQVLMYQEQPDAYKEIGAIIRDLEEAGLIKVVAVLRPVVTFKTKAPPRKPPPSWKEERRQASLLV